MMVLRLRCTVIVFVTVCCLLATGSFGFQPSLMPHSHLKLQQQVRQEISLNMGLRTFIKSKLGRGKDDSVGSSSKMTSTESTPKKKKRKNKKSKVAATKAATEVVADKPKDITIPSEAAAATTTPINAKTAVAAPTAQAASSVKKDTQQRLPPLRRESVQDRLNRVRSGQMTDDEKQAFLRTALSAGDTSTSRKPLRQELPDDSGDSKRPKNGGATPYPKDSLLSNMARGWGSSQNSTGMGDIPLRSWKDGAQLEDQKKKREYFDMVTNPNRFHTYKSSMVTQPGETDMVDPSVHDGLVIPQVGDDVEETDAVVSKVTEEEVLEDIKEYEQTIELSGDLGSRLEQAAHALEEASKRKEVERKEKEQRLKQQRLEERTRIAELQRKQQLEMEKRELELKAKKREEEEAMARERERRRREEEIRLRELQKAQDAYWEKKLQAEKKSRMERMTESQRRAFEKHEAEAEEKAAKLAEQEAEALESMQGAKEDGESESQIELPVANYASKESPKGSESYDALRERKRREMEQARDDQLAQLKALNSPLPTPSSRAPPAASPFVPSDSYARRGLPNGTPAPAPPANILKSEPTIADMMEDVDVDEIVEVESSAGPGFLSRVMGGKKDDSSSNERTTPNAPEPKRIVRQKLPLEDEEVDFDTYDRNGPSGKMSIADAMRASGDPMRSDDQEQRSKMWGVDMSRIAKSLEDENKK